MEIGAIGKYLVVVSMVGVLLTIGCTAVSSSGDAQTDVVTYPRSTLGIVAPIHYLSVVNGSDPVITTLVLNLTIASDTIQDHEININQMAITVADNQNLRILDRGEYYITRWENDDGDDTLEVGEVVEVVLPLQQSIPAGTDIYVDVWTPYHGTLTLSFRTPDRVTPSGQITEFTAAPFVLW